MPIETAVFQAIGLMSGTSLDGLDIAAVDFWKENHQWKFRILKAETVEYSATLRKKIEDSFYFSAADLRALDVELGHFFGVQVDHFIHKHHLQPLLVASHGQTIFHQPNLGYSLQIGDGSALQSHLSVPVIFDFRSADIALGGQGAPLVPFGDLHLFSEYEACLNLGGFANVFDKKSNLAWDISPMNFLMNHIAQRFDLEYDKGGVIAQSGSVNRDLLHELNALSYYQQKPPKSLGREWVEDHIFSLESKFSISNADLMRTYFEHSLEWISKGLSHIKGDILVTGGGANNTFFMDRLRAKLDANMVVPDNNIINYKEALVFAFLGLMRLQKKPNVLHELTGARKSCSAGIMCIPT